MYTPCNLWKGELCSRETVKIDIPSFNKVSNPSVQNYCIRHPICIHTHKENSQIITTGLITTIQYIINLFHIWFTQHIYIFSWFSFLKNWKRVVDSGRHEGDDNNIKVNITDDGDVPPYRIQSSVHVSGTSSQFLSLSGKSSRATEQGQWFFGTNVLSLLPVSPAPLLTAKPALINNSCTTN